MAKLTLEELKKKYNEKITDNDDLLIELMEDLTDSIDVSKDIEDLKATIEVKEKELADLKEKYKQRFLNAVEEVKEENEDLEEKEIIDIKEI